MSRIHHVRTLCCFCRHIINVSFFFICTQTCRFQITLSDFLTMASAREKILQTRNRSRSPVGYILILLAFHLPRVIDFRETSARGKPRGDGWQFTTRPYDGCRAFYFRLRDKIGIRFASRVILSRLDAASYFETIVSVTRLEEMEESLINRCFDRAPPRHVRAPIQLKHRKQTRTLEEEC